MLALQSKMLRKKKSWLFVTVGLNYLLEKILDSQNVTCANNVVNLICFVYTMIINLLISLIKGNTTIFKQKYYGYKSGFHFLTTNSSK